jgi:thymidylate synthase (FAD)
MIEVTYKGHMGNDLTVCNAARVSFGKETEWDYEESDAYSFKQHLKKKDEKLIQYLAKHRHTSPFGHCFASFHIKAPYVGMRYRGATRLKILSFFTRQSGVGAVKIRSRGLRVL